MIIVSEDFVFMKSSLEESFEKFLENPQWNIWRFIRGTFNVILEGVLRKKSLNMFGGIFGRNSEGFSGGSFEETLEKNLEESSEDSWESL